MEENKSIVFMGTSDFSLKALIALYEAKFPIVGVYTQAPKPAGRSYKIQKSIVHKFAEEKKLPVYCPRSFKSAGEVELFRSLNPDVAVVSSYGLIIPKELLNIPPAGFINIHASLLPRWRGAAPIQSAILAGDQKTGITIMKMDDGVDTGDIISQKSVDISPRTSHGELADQLGDLGAAMILETLNNLDYSIPQSRKQPADGVTYAKKISKNSCRINWNDSAENVLRHIKAFSSIPAAWTEIDDILLKIFNAEIVDKNVDVQCGTINENMIVTCKTGALKLTEIQPSGKNKMSGEDFIRGRKNLIGRIIPDYMEITS
ncbi:MAG: methionyl-tRNA formyltransferase [Holosporaceae bacterium]|jgi:methionyl-tRNA formyltransferase|nr:methionyl-tRNA formyltransferase [Holosporaceae bacterium]